MHGARAQVIINNKIVGLFTTCSYGMAYDLATVAILGRFGPAELVYVGQEAVNISCSGYRVVGHGPHVDGQMPAVQNLMTAGYVEFVILDRQTGQRIARIHSAKATNWSMNVSAKSPMDFSMSFTGMLASDESVDNSEGAGARRRDE
jgi:hypothetical protein